MLIDNNAVVYELSTRHIIVNYIVTMISMLQWAWKNLNLLINKIEVYVNAWQKERQREATMSGAPLPVCYITFSSKHLGTEACCGFKSEILSHSFLILRLQLPSSLRSLLLSFAPKKFGTYVQLGQVWTVGGAVYYLQSFDIRPCCFICAEFGFAL